jgi:hypothetical protein
MGHKWARELAATSAWVLHTPTRVVGEVDKFFDGEAEQYISTLDERPVPGPVLRLKSGHAFNALDQAHFVPLSEQERIYYSAAQKAMTGFLVELAKLAAGLQMPITTAHVLMLSILETQLDVLRASAPRPRDDVLG